MSRFTARFYPEAWVRNNAVEVDAEGPQEWDCTVFASTAENTEYLEDMRTWFSEHDGWVLDADDVFKNDPAAPQWVREWRWPFTIKVREEKESIA